MDEYIFYIFVYYIYKLRNNNFILCSEEGFLNRIIELV